MAPNPRVAKAFRAMKEIGILEEKTKPVLKNLLKIYEKNWELIEAENYRALADAIFDSEEAEVCICFHFLFVSSIFSFSIYLLLRIYTLLHITDWYYFFRHQNRRNHMILLKLK